MECMEIAKHFRGIKKQNFKTLKMYVGDVKKYDFFMDVGQPKTFSIGENMAHLHTSFHVS